MGTGDLGDPAQRLSVPGVEIPAKSRRASEGGGWLAPGCGQHAERGTATPALWALPAPRDYESANASSCPRRRPGNARPGLGT